MPSSADADSLPNDRRPHIARGMVTRRAVYLREFGESLRRLRLERGFSQEDLADKSGLHRTYVGGVERGERNISLENIHRLARALGVDVRELFG